MGEKKLTKVSENPQVTTITTPHKVEVLFSRDLLRAAPDVPEQVAADRGVPEWVKPRICGHDRSLSVHYTWEWATREVVTDA
jgi:hypothetical protein